MPEEGQPAQIPPILTFFAFEEGGHGGPPYGKALGWQAGQPKAL